MKNHRTTRIRRDDAISPVIGTILMVAATVIIAGAVYTAINAYNGKTVKGAPDAAFKAQALDTDGDGLEDVIKVTYLSGPADVSAAALTTTVKGTLNGTAVTPLSPPASWNPGDYNTYDAPAGTYFVTVRMSDNTMLDQTITVKE